jgi:hypothetical protein
LDSQGVSPSIPGISAGKWLKNIEVQIFDDEIVSDSFI